MNQSLVGVDCVTLYKVYWIFLTSLSHLSQIVQSFLSVGHGAVITLSLGSIFRAVKCLELDLRFLSNDSFVLLSGSVSSIVGKLGFRADIRSCAAHGLGLLSLIDEIRRIITVLIARLTDMTKLSLALRRTLPRIKTRKDVFALALVQELEVRPGLIRMTLQLLIALSRSTCSFFKPIKIFHLFIIQI